MPKKLTKKCCRLVGILVKRMYIFVMFELLDACFVPQPAEKWLNPNPQLFWSTLIRSNTQYVSWTDTMIRVKVPSTGRDLDNPAYMGGVVNASASSEFIGIFDLNTSPPIVQSPQPIYVKYSAVNQAYQSSGNEHVAKVKLANRNGLV